MSGHVSRKVALDILASMERKLRIECHVAGADPAIGAYLAFELAMRVCRQHSNLSRKGLFDTAREIIGIMEADSTLFPDNVVAMQ